jgi:hypothetical protein
VVPQQGSSHCQHPVSPEERRRTIYLGGFPSPIPHAPGTACLSALASPLALFAFVIEILDGDGPKPGSFWMVPKKCCCHLPKKPKDPEEKTPGPQDKTPTVSHKALADVQKPVASGNDAMTGVVPSVQVDLPQPPSSSLLPARSPGHLPYVNTFVSANPFPVGHDQEAMYQWRRKAEAVGIPRMIMAQIAKEAGLIKSELHIFKEISLSFPCK